MTLVLITGMSGTGKSTVMSILHQRGYAVVETDEPGWCVPENGDWSTPDHTWIWNEQRISRVLDNHASTHVIVDGCRPNQGRFYDRFDHVVVFIAPIDVMLDRVRNRSGNPFGRSREEQDKITRDKQDFEPMLLASADVVIDTSATLPDSVADRIEGLL